MEAGPCLLFCVHWCELRVTRKKLRVSMSTYMWGPVSCWPCLLNQSISCYANKSVNIFLKCCRSTWRRPARCCPICLINHLIIIYLFQSINQFLKCCRSTWKRPARCYPVCLINHLIIIYLFKSTNQFLKCFRSTWKRPARCCPSLFNQSINSLLIYLNQFINVNDILGALGEGQSGAV